MLSGDAETQHLVPTRGPFSCHTCCKFHSLRFRKERREVNLVRCGHAPWGRREDTSSIIRRTGDFPFLTRIILAVTFARRHGATSSAEFVTVSMNILCGFRKALGGRKTLQFPPHGKCFQRNRQDEAGRTCPIFAHCGAKLHTVRKERTGILFLGDFVVCAGLPQTVDREVALPLCSCGDSEVRTRSAPEKIRLA